MTAPRKKAKSNMSVRGGSVFGRDPGFRLPTPEVVVAQLGRKKAKIFKAKPSPAKKSALYSDFTSIKTKAPVVEYKDRPLNGNPSQRPRKATFLSSAPRPPLHYCGLCQQSWVDLQMHLRLRHQVDTVGEVSSAAWVVCAECKASFARGTRYLQHLASCPKVPAVKSKRRQGDAKHRTNNMRRPVSDPSIPVVSRSLVAENDNRLDGSRHGHVFRDHGQFGSYPAFDRMDGEEE